MRVHVWIALCLWLVVFLWLCVTYGDVIIDRHGRRPRVEDVHLPQPPAGQFCEIHGHQGLVGAAALAVPAVGPFRCDLC